MHQTQTGFAHILMLLLLLGGLAAGVYLVQNKTNLFSRAASGPISSPVGFSNLSANFQPAQATLNFQYSGGGNSRYHVDLSTTKDMSWDVYLDFATGTGSPIVVSNPTKWDKYSCGRTLYWRVYNSDRTAKSSIQATDVQCGGTGSGFTSLSASFPLAGPATYNFNYSGSATYFSVHMSTTANMSYDIYWNFGGGSKSPITVLNPASRWDKYSCGKILYWQIVGNNNQKSPIQSTTISCGATTQPGFSQLSASFPLAGPATYKFNYGGSATYFSVHMATTSNMSWDVYWNFGGGSKSPVVVTNPTKWDKYSCGRILYWKITSNKNESSAIQSTPVICSTPTPTLRPTVTPTSTPQAAKRVFVTSTTYNGNLGGLVGADAKCQARANSANLGGSWKAWLSDSRTSAVSRLSHATVPYKLLNGKVVANNWADLTDGQLKDYANIKVYENGQERVEYSGTQYVWTGTNETGGVTGSNCSNWTTSVASAYVNNQLVYYRGTYGTVSSINLAWTKAWSGSDSCHNTYRLYCFEQ